MKQILAIVAVCLCLVVVLVVTAQDATDEPPDLIIPVEELGTETELMDQLVEHYGDEIVVEITPELTRILEAVEADDGSLSEVLSDVLGEEIRLPDEQPYHYSSKVWERRTTDEILARMKPEHVEALADQRHLLDDEQQLFLVMDEWEGVQHDAALEFLSKLSRPDPIKSMMPPELRREIEQAQERGWYDLPGTALGSQLMRQVELMGEDGLTQLRRTSLEIDSHREREDGGLAGPTGGYSFMLPGYEQVDVFPDTKFGAVLSVEKTVVDEVHFDNPNLVIDGYDASLSVGQHADGGWVTVVSAFDGRHLYEVVLERKLDDAERDEFILTATGLIQGSHSAGDQLRAEHLNVP